MSPSSLDQRPRRLSTWMLIAAALLLLLLISIGIAQRSIAQSEPPAAGASSARERLNPGLAVDFPVDI